MKAKTKKIALALLVSAVVAAGAAALAGCNKGGSEHTHEYGAEWSFNDTYHFHKCTAEGCNSVKGSSMHELAETNNTATCTDAGVKTSGCSACGYESTETSPALGHDWDYGNAECEATHLHGATVSCKRDGCTATTETEPVPHTYGNWTYKDINTHTGTCTEPGCEGVEPAVREHRLGGEHTVKNFTVYTCQDCGAELGEVQIGLITNSSTEAKLEKNVKVSLYAYDEASGKHVKVCETVSESGVATFLVTEGVYYPVVEDDEVFSSDAIPVEFGKTDFSIRPYNKMVVGGKKHYTCTLYYGAGNTPAANVNFDIVTEIFTGEYTNTMPVVSGTTNADGVLEFDFCDNFDSFNIYYWYIALDGYDTENYKFTDTVKFGKDTSENFEVRLSPKNISYNVKVRAGGEFVDGVEVTLKKTVNAEGTTVTTANGGVAAFAEMESYQYIIGLALPELLAAEYRAPRVEVYTTIYESEVIVDLIDINPTFKVQLQVSGNNGLWVNFAQAGVKIILKDGDETVAEGFTDENGVFSAPKLVVKSYKVYIDSDTVPAGYTYVDDSKSTGTAIENATNTVECNLILSELVDLVLVVRSGSEGNYTYHQGVTVTLKDGAKTVFTDTTDSEGKVTYTCIKNKSFKLTLTNLPENLICTTTTVISTSGGEHHIDLSVPTVYAFTLKDTEGNALAGATVKMNVISWNSRQNRYDTKTTITGTADENGLVSFSYKTGTDVYSLDIVGADGTKYYCNETFVYDTVGDVYNKELTVYTYGNSIPYTETPAYNVNSLVADKGDTLVLLSSKREEEFAIFMTDANWKTVGLTGTYKITITNPDGIAYDLTFKSWDAEANSGWGSWVTTTVDDLDFITVDERDEDGNIVSMTYTGDGTGATPFRFMFTTLNDNLAKFTVSVEKVESSAD